MLPTPFGSEFWVFCRTVTPASRLRLAPTPSGYLHIGNALNFVLNWLATRQCPGARLFLRIDDLDADRARPEYVQDVFDTLEWLGLDWDEGPLNATDFDATWSQRHRLPQYLGVLEALRRSGRVFACTKSRNDLAPYKGQFPLHFRDQGLSPDLPGVAWRIMTPEPALWPSPMPSDFIIRRRDGIPAYQVASLTDDVHFGITHLIRGDDLAASTSAQQFLASCLDWSAFAKVLCLHHPLIQDGGGMKLSKSAGASSLRSWRAENRSPEAVFHTVSAFLGLPEPAGSAVELLKAAGRDKT